MLDSQVVAFTMVAALLTLIPGADTMLVVRNVLRGGKRCGAVTTVGICSGLFIHAALSALGVSMILVHSAELFQMLKIAGAGYIIWLGWQSIRGALVYADGIDLSSDLGHPPNRLMRRTFLEGLFCNVLNPKVAVFYLAFLPQFIGPADCVLSKSLLLAGIHCTMGLLWLLCLSVMLDRTRRFLLKPTVRSWLDGICGSVLVLLGLKLAFDRS